MTAALLVVLLLCAVTGLALLAKRANLPYPVAFVVGGTVLAFIPGLPRVRIDPDYVFLLVLPPLLWGAAWSTDWVEFRRSARPIGMLAFGLVAFTTAIVAIVSHALAPALTWPLAFVLGAVVSPPDAVAAEAVLERLAVPRRVAAVLSGESLVNDASALVIYQLAVVAAVTGAFTWHTVLLRFVAIAVGGVAIGLAISYAVEWTMRGIRKRELADASILNAITFMAPYACYLCAEAAHVSGVLATVAAGIRLGRRSAFIMDSESRLVGSATWSVFTFLLNGGVFIALGLQLPDVVATLSSAHVSPSRLVADAAGLSALVILVRIVWVFVVMYLPPWLKARRHGNEVPPWREVLLTAWTGMRGIVSLAAALAVPAATAAGAPILARNEIIFMTFCVIFATLVLQGCTLAPLIDRLGIAETSARSKRETEVRIAALKAGIDRLRALERSFDSSDEWEAAGRIRAEYDDRIRHLEGHLADDGDDVSAENEIDHHLQAEALQAERAAILKARARGKIPDDIFRSIQYDLDLADLRLR